ncbi:MAG: hypothetical protein IPP33_17045 [Flavobacteriales bacterium]|nr:hypothetical protein [Flavobacteriales bacterium]
MKKAFFLFVLCCSLGSVSAQQSDNETGVIVASGFHITRPLSEIFTENPVDENKVYEKKESRIGCIASHSNFLSPLLMVPSTAIGPGTIQEKMGMFAGAKPAPTGQDRPPVAFRPYDPSGAVGPNHYVQMINSTTFKV